MGNGRDPLPFSWVIGIGILWGVCLLTGCVLIGLTIKETM